MTPSYHCPVPTIRTAVIAHLPAVRRSAEAHRDDALNTTVRISDSEHGNRLSPTRVAMAMSTTSSMTSAVSGSPFRCRRAESSDVASLFSLLSQQRLAGVAYEDSAAGGASLPQAEPVAADNVAPSGSPASLFSVRSARNLQQLQRWWGVGDEAALRRLIRTQWQALVVEDGAGLLALAAFHIQPNTAALRAAPSPAAWPSWVAAAVGRSASALRPSSTLFLTFFACAALANGRQECAVSDLLVQAAFRSSARIARLALLQPPVNSVDGPVPAPALRGSPLEAAFRLFGHVDAQPPPPPPPASPSTAPPQPLSCFLVARDVCVPRLSVRRAVLEDHDDLLPLFERETALSAATLGPFFLASLVEPGALTGSAERSAAPPSLLSALQSPSSVALVAECDGRAVGLLCLTPNVDVERLNAAFDTDDLGELTTTTTTTTTTQLATPLEADREDAQDEGRPLSAALRARLGDLFPLLSVGVGDGADTSALLEALCTALPEALAGSAGPRALAAAAEAFSAWEQQPRQSEVADASAFAALCADAALAVVAAVSAHWDGRGAAPSASVFSQQWAAALGVRLRPAPAAAFAVSCFVLDSRFAWRASELLLPAFAAFPSSAVLVLSLPHEAPACPLLSHMTPLRKRRGAGEGDCPHAAYVLHRHTALSMSDGHAAVDVAEARLHDEADLRRLLTAQARAEEESDDSLSARLRSLHRALQRQEQRPQSASTARCLVVRCAGEAIGFVRTAALRSAEQLSALRAHYALDDEDGSDGGDGAGADVQQRQPQRPEYECHALLRHFVLHPLMAPQASLVLVEALRLTGASSLHYAVEPSGAFHPVLVRAMRQQRPLTPPSPPRAQRPEHALQGPEREHSAAQDDGRINASPSPSMAAASTKTDAAAAAFVAPGPPLSSLASTAALRSPPCSACGERNACPRFALYSTSYPSLCAPRATVNARVLVVGAGHTALAAVERLLLDRAAFFAHITVLARSHSHMRARQQGDAEYAAALTAALLPGDLSFEPDRVRRLCLDARVRFVEGAVRDIDSAARIVRFAAAGGAEAALYYDELLLATGLQPNARAVTVRREADWDGVAQTEESADDAALQPTMTASSEAVPLAASPSPLVAPVGRARDAVSGRSVSPAPGSSTAASSVASSRPPSSAPPAVDDVSGVFRLSNEESADALFARLLSRDDADARRRPSAALRVLVSGASLQALSALSAMLSLGIGGDRLTWVHSARHGAEPTGEDGGSGGAQDGRPVSLSRAVFGEEQCAALGPALQALAVERVRVVSAAHVASLLVGGPGEDGCGAAALRAVVLSGGDVLPCSALLLCDERCVDDAVYACIRRMGLVFDGRLVVDERCATVAPHVRAAGPLAKFQRRAAPSESAARSSGEPLLPLLEHSTYHSAAAGQLAAEQLVHALTDAAATLSAERALAALRDRPCVVYARLPGSLCFFHAWTPAVSSVPSACTEERSLSQAFPSYAVTLTYSPSSLRVLRLRYHGQWQLPVHNLVRLVGLPVTFLQRALQRWEAGQLRSLLLFVQQDWASPLYTHAFAAQRARLVHQLTHTHAEHMRPLLAKLSAWQSAHARAVTDIAGGRQPKDDAASGDGGVREDKAVTPEPSAASLQSLSSFLPLRFREEVHRALLRFVHEQRALLPESLRSPPTFNRGAPHTGTHGLALPQPIS